MSLGKEKYIVSKKKAIIIGSLDPLTGSCIQRVKAPGASKGEYAVRLTGEGSIVYNVSENDEAVMRRYKLWRFVLLQEIISNRNA